MDVQSGTTAFIYFQNHPTHASSVGSDILDLILPLPLMMKGWLMLVCAVLILSISPMGYKGLCTCDERIIRILLMEIDQTKSKFADTYV